MVSWKRLTNQRNTRFILIHLTMKTIKDFKERIKVGVKINTVLYKKLSAETEHEPVMVFPTREISVVQSNRFACATPKDGKMVNSWCDFPKSYEFKVLSDNSIMIDRGISRLVYAFVE